VAVVNLVKQEIAKINKTLPPGMTLNIAIDQSTFIKRSIAEVQKHLILGGLFAILAVFLFSGTSGRHDQCGGPADLDHLHLCLDPGLRFTFNNMTMLALTCRRAPHRRRHHRHREHLPACRGGDGAAGGLDFRHLRDRSGRHGNTFAIVAIFLPVAFMKGMIGRFFSSSP